MLGHRGCRLGITYPEIYEMQARAIFEAAATMVAEGKSVVPEVMVPARAGITLSASAASTTSMLTIIVRLLLKLICYPLVEPMWSGSRLGRSQN